jgi:hypothetical protein
MHTGVQISSARSFFRRVSCGQPGPGENDAQVAGEYVPEENLRIYSLKKTTPIREKKR